MEKQKTTSTIHKDANYIFLKNMDQNEEERLKPIGKFNQHIKHIKEKLQGLEREDREEWSRILTTKCYSLSKGGKVGELKRTVRVLVFCCNELRIAYDSKGIETLLKKQYFEQFGKQIVRQFAVADYDLQGYEVLEYEQPWYSKLYSYFIS